MKIVMSRTWVKMAAAVAVAGLAASACGSTQLGAAAITGNSRISSSELTSQVTNLNSAYAADKAKGIKPQRATSQATQQVLTWLITFRVYDQLATQHHIGVSPAQVEAQVSKLNTTAKSDKVTLSEYVSAGGALPPDLVNDLGRYFVISDSLVYRLDGGKTPSTSAAQLKVETALAHQQCLASKALGVNVNPQYGVWNYRTYTVVPAPPTLAADPTPSPTTSPILTKAPC